MDFPRLAIWWSQINWNAVLGVSGVLAAIFTCLTYIEARSAKVDPRELAVLFVETAHVMNSSTLDKNIQTKSRPSNKSSEDIAMKSSQPGASLSASSTKATEAANSAVLTSCMVLASVKYDVPSAILLGIYSVKRGKNGEEYSVNKSGQYELGLMKIKSRYIPIVAEKLQYSDSYTKRLIKDDACMNIGVAAWIFAKIAKETSLRKAIAIYNDGSTKENEIFQRAVINFLHESNLIQQK